MLSSYFLIIQTNLHVSGSKNLSRLEILALDFNTINGSNLEESLQVFPSIRNLTLSQNKFKGKTLAKGNNLSYTV